MLQEPRRRLGIPASSHRAAVLAGGLMLVVHTAPTRADCPAINFDDRPVGTIITNQYPGVTFSVHPQSCGGAPPVNVRIANAPPGGTSSGTRALRIDTGCPDFSPDYVRIRFDELQHAVSFTLGAATGSAGRSYDVIYSGDAFGEIDTMFVTSAAGVHRLVTITAPAGWSGIRTIEIEAPDWANYEVIDDLAFEMDTTPPLVEIDEPAFSACGCGVVPIRGSVCEPESAYAGDRAEYRAANAAAADPWQPIDDCPTPICQLCLGGLLYSWDTAGLAHGLYFVRVTAANACGLEASDVTVVYVDRQFDTVEIRQPSADDVVGGSVCIDGTVVDYPCFDSYKVEYWDAAAALWRLILNSAVAVINDPLVPGGWDTVAGGVAEGDTTIRVTARDTCGNTEVVLRDVTVDNIAPDAEITEPANCDVIRSDVESVTVRGRAEDANLAWWSLSYTGGDEHGWVEINRGVAPVAAGVLGEWDTGALRPCAYTLWLRVADRAVVSCDDPHVTDYYTSVIIACEGDIDRSGVVDLGDLTILLANFGALCP